MRQTLKQLCVAAAAAVLTATALPANAFAANSSGGGLVSVTQDDGSKTVTIGNDQISRTFSWEDALTTTKIDNKRAGTTLVPAAGSEEFIVKMTRSSGSQAQSGALDRSGWTATDDSHAKTGTAEGPASTLIDGDLNTFWHTYYSNNDGPNTDPNSQKTAFPYSVTFDLKATQTVRAFGWTPRQHSLALEANGNVKGYKLYVSNAETAPATDDAWGEPVSQGDLPQDGTNTVYVNLDRDYQARWVKFVATSSPNGRAFAGGAEFNLYPKQVKTESASDDYDFAASELTVTGEPEVLEASATINSEKKSGKEVVFSFAPYTFRGVDYTVREHIVMYDGDHYMRKFLEISVPEDQKDAAVIDYIDLESLKLTAEAQKTSWTVPKAGGIVQMDEFKANLGQPIYVEGMFLGCEFPETDTQIADGTGYMRYYTGKSFARLVADNQAGEKDGSVTYNTWQTVAGAARSTDTSVVQQDFYSYIDDIATPSEFRSQYNSWFDNMMYIDDTNILTSFIEVNKQLEAAGAAPLGSYVVDDGWNNYHSNYGGDNVDDGRSGTGNNTDGFWTFNTKFPNGFTKDASLVQKLGSNFGVWIGPRGGYNYYSQLADIITRAGNGSKAGNSIDVADRRYVAKYAELATKWQDDYHVNYWKWDGFADQAQYNAFAAVDGVPGYANGHMTGGYKGMYHVTDLWEAWIDLFEKVRANAAQNNIPDLWISLTCYVNPSPWWLQWANSVWLQCTADQADAGASNSKMDRQLTYRDACYYDFIVNHQFQFPLVNVYNHDPIYGKTDTGITASTATDVQFANYLYTQASRGTAFWELYYSESIMSQGKWEVTSRFLEWAEENNHLLRNAKMFGGSPNSRVSLTTMGNKVEAGSTYGFAGFDGDEGLIMVRNPSNTAKSISFTFDAATLGVAMADAGTKFSYTIEHSYNPESSSTLKDTPSDGGVKTDGTGTFSYGNEVTVSLEPDEVITFHVTRAGAGDKDAPRIASVATDGDRTLTVKFNEFVRGQKIEVAGQTVESVTPSADRVTYAVKLASAPKDGTLLTVSAGDDIEDMAGNKAADAKDAATGNAASVVYRKGNEVASKATKSYEGQAAALGSAAKSLQGANGFTVAVDVTTSGTGVLASQSGGYEVGLDDEGKPYITLNSATATAETVVNDGKAHRLSFVKANNGILKVYVDGELSGSAYKAENKTFAITAGKATLGNPNFTGTLGAKVYDRALGYDEIADADDVTPEPATNVAQGKTVTAKKLDGSSVTVNGERPGNMAVDGNNPSNPDANYMDFGEDAYTGVSYMQVDLGAVYQLQNPEGGETGAIKMWRYWKDGRTYDGTVIAVSENGSFTGDDVKVIYNSDASNAAGFGEGAEPTYAESAAGKGFSVPAGTKARYVRVYMQGSSAGNTNHIVELQVFGVEAKDDVTPSAPDTSELEAAIDNLRQKIDSGRYSAESVETARAVITAAEALLNGGEALTDEQIAEQLAALNKAEDDLAEIDTSATGSIEFLGASLRYSADVSTKVDGLRLGYTFRVPEGCEIDWSQSGWEYGLDNSVSAGFRAIDRKAENEDGSFTANLVFTNIPVKNYGTNLYARAKLVYKDKEGVVQTVTREVVDSRSATTWATAVSGSSTASDAEKQLADDILAADESNWTGYDKQ